jgi:hypothetical protein
VDDGRTVPRIRPGAQPREGGEARPKVELVVGDLNDPASLKPAFASVDEAFVVVNGKNLNRLEANALDRSRAFKRLRLRWRQRERGVAEDVRVSILGPAERDRAGGLFRSGDMGEPASTSAKALSFSTPRRTIFFSLAASSGFDKPSEDWISPYLRSLRKH